MKGPRRRSYSNPAPEEWPEQQRAVKITNPAVQARQGSHRISQDT